MISWGLILDYDTKFHSLVGKELSFLQIWHCLVILFPLLMSHIFFSYFSWQGRHLLFLRFSFSKHLQVGPSQGCVPDTLYSTHLMTVTTLSFSTHPFLHLSTSTSCTSALSSNSCHYLFSFQPLPHNLTDRHLSSWWLSPLYSLYHFLCILLTCCASASLGCTALFGQLLYP